MHKLLKFKKEIFVFFLISLAYFALRLIFLNKLPIFTDEAIYIRWAQIALHDSSWRFISLTDGKQPMFIWFMVIFLKLINDPLIAGRLVSVASGFFTLIGLFFLSFELFKSKRVSFITIVLYVCFPMAQVYDRMAIYDSLVATFSIWALYFSVLLVRKLRLDLAYTLGLVIGGGILTKSSNFFSIYLLPFMLILFDFKKKPVTNRLFKFITLALFSTILAYAAYNILRLSPLFEMINAKNAIFVYPISEWLTHPFTFFLGNLHGLFSWLTQYLTIFYLVLIIAAFIPLKQYFREKLLLLVYFLLPFLALALFGRVIFPRFIFFMSLYLIILASLGLSFIFNWLISIIKTNNRLRQKLIFMAILFVFAAYPAVVSFTYAIAPSIARIADADSSQYANSWASGWGAKESIDFFKIQAKTQKIYIATEGTFGLLPEVLEMYLVDNKNIKIQGYWPVDKFPKEVLEAARKMPTYFVFYQKEHMVIPSDYPLVLLFKVQQGTNNSFYRVYQVLPTKSK